MKGYKQVCTCKNDKYMFIYIFSLKIIFDRLIKKHISWYKVIDIEKQIPENAFLSILAI